MKKEIIPVKLNEPYNIYIGRGLMKNAFSVLNRIKAGDYAVIVTTKRIYAIYGRLVRSVFPSKSYKIILVSDGEKAKTAKWLFTVIRALLTADTLNRKIFLVCLGGGTVGDLGGFAASIYKRGIPYVQIPTTLIGQIDSSIGGKTAIDLPEAKNILGAFYHPRAVLIDPLFLNSLPHKEIRQGISEAIKYGVIKSKDLFCLLKGNSQEIIRLDQRYLEKVISTCAKIKAEIVEEDEREKKGVRTILNFGHTFAHALESAFKYRKKVPHGDAVALGMLYAARLSFSLKICGQETVNKISEILTLYKLPRRVRFKLPELYRALCYDKKFTSGRIRMVLLKRIGEVKVVKNVDSGKLKKTLADFNRRSVDK